MFVMWLMDTKLNRVVVRELLTHDSRAPPVASQHKFIVQPLVIQEWNAGIF